MHCPGVPHKWTSLTEHVSKTAFEQLFGPLQAWFKISNFFVQSVRGYHKVRLTYRRYMFGYVRLYVWICKVICDGKWVKCP